MLDLTNKHIVITGGTSGIGLASARLFLEAGARVAICGRNAERLEVALTQLRAVAPDCIHGVVCDVTDKTQVNDWCQVVIKQFDHIDALICNAGQGRQSTFASTDDDDWDEEVQLKLYSVVYPVRGLHSALKKSHSASIVCVNSLLARQPEAHMVATSAARALVVNLVRSLATEFAPDNIRVNSILLGLIDSGQWRRRYESSTDKDTPYETWLAQLAARKNIPLGRLGVPSEPARAIAFLASPWASYITGTSLDVSGGLSRYA